MYSERIELGTFDVVSGKMVVSDPGYKPGTWCMGELSSVLNGTWHAMAIRVDAGEWGERIAQLIVHHEDYPHAKALTLHTAEFDVGVDSGQAGFFDSHYYQANDSVPESHSDFGDNWYSYCCDITLSRMQAGTLPYGAVSRSGFGDGGYVCRYWKAPNRRIVKAEIIFITKKEMADFE